MSKHGFPTKYRGKKVGSDVWVYGFLIGLAEEPECWITGGYFDIHWSVEPSTVGICIGVVDKHGRELYTGDIILHPRQDRPHSQNKKVRLVECVIEYSQGIHKNGQQNENPSRFQSAPKFTAHPINKETKESKWGYNWSVFHDCEWVGTIHDKKKIALAE